MLTADLDAKDRFDVTAVHMAAEYGHVHCLKLLLDAGAACITGTKYSKRGAWTGVFNKVSITHFSLVLGQIFFSYIS